MKTFLLDMMVKMTAGLTNLFCIGLIIILKEVIYIPGSM